MKFKSWLTSVGAAAILTSIAFVSRGAEPRGNITGIVRTASGSAAEGALVKARHTSGLMVTVVSQTGGRYSITDLPPGRYNLRGTGGGYQSDSTPDPEVASGKNTTVDLTLSTAQSFLDARSISKLAELMPEDKGKA